MTHTNNQLKFIGRHKENDVFYFIPGVHGFDSLPDKNWICLGIANSDFNKGYFEEFVIYSASSGLLEFIGQGKYGELLHDWFDETIVEYEYQEEVKTDIMTLWRNDQTNDLADSFWGCFYANVLPENVQQSQIVVVCMSFEGQDYSNTIQILLEKINNGWIPPDE